MCVCGVGGGGGGGGSIHDLGIFEVAMGTYGYTRQFDRSFSLAWTVREI